MIRVTGIDLFLYIDLVNDLSSLWLSHTLSFRSEYVFNFDSTFELHRDVDVLKKLGLDSGLHSGQCSQDSLQQAKAMLPKVFESTLDGKREREKESVCDENIVA